MRQSARYFWQLVKRVSCCYVKGMILFRDPLFFSHGKVSFLFISRNETWAVSTLRRRNLKTEVSLWKCIKCFPSTLRRRNLKTPQSAVISFGFVFEENSVREISWPSWCHRFRKAPFSKYFPSNENAKPTVVFKFVLFEERCRKVPFSWQISVDGSPNRGSKVAFSNFSGEVSTGLKIAQKKKRSNPNLSQRLSFISPLC